MKSIRYNVFETNSSPTHSLSLLKTNRKFTKVGKLEAGNTYVYKALGRKDSQMKYKGVYSSEFEKLCVCFDLLFLDFTNKCFISNDRPTNLNRFKKSDDDNYFILLNRYYLQKFLKGNYYKEFNMVLHKHNISFEINDAVLGFKDGQKRPIYCTNFDRSAFDFMYHFSQWGFQSVAEAVDTIVFNPNFIFELEYSKGF